MVTSFIVLVQFPDALNDLTSRNAWTALCMETALIGAAWIIAGCVASAGLPAEQQQHNY